MHYVRLEVQAKIINYERAWYVVLSPLTYLVDANGLTVKRHQDQLRSCYNLSRIPTATKHSHFALPSVPVSTITNDSLPMLPDDNNIVPTDSDNTTTSTPSTTSTHIFEDTSTPLRRSTRTHKPVNRYSPS